jgi:hypothetical protein
MIPVPDLCDTPLEAERAALPRCREHRARLLDAALRRRSPPAATAAQPTAPPRGRLARALRSLRRVLRPMHA